ncbi:MAG: sigma-70 family RNA polymerase sigma factor [Symploca sp. SIO2C1]|nr:sigma-70 family RNA polymerase sigma factor [Symploca sp. SIO2C1]
MHEEIETQLSQLVAQTCQYPHGSLERRQCLTKLIQAIIKSGKLWWENTPYYEEALQQTWLYMCRNICEANTGGQYDPTRGSVTTWLDRYLKRRLQDFWIEEQQNKKRYISLGKYKDDTTNPIENVPAPQRIPILQETRNWAEIDSDGELRRTHIKKRPDLSCQVLILRRLPPKTSWQELAAEFNCPYQTLANFYKRQCRPRLRKFGESQGYL